MSEIKCPYDLNQFLLGEPTFENTFPEEECEQRKFYGDCYHCFSTAIARRDRQFKAIRALDKAIEAPEKLGMNEMIPSNSMPDSNLGDCISREEAKRLIRRKFKDLPTRCEINEVLNSCPAVNIDAIVAKIEAMKEKDVLCKYPYGRCIELIKTMIGGVTDGT